MKNYELSPIIDSHCHLDFPDFDDDLKETIKRAEDFGVIKMLTICTKPSELKKVLNISETYSSVFFAVGSHPLSIAKGDVFSHKQLLEISQHSKMIGIGETGLDYFYSSENSDEQKRHFRLHISVARETGLPLIVHSRTADEDMANLLLEEYKNGPFDCVMHCFSSGEALAKIAIELGFYLSISGIAAFPKNEELRSLFAGVPKNRILVETDSPYLAPPPYRGRRNEPAYVSYTTDLIAEYLGISRNDFRKQTTKNFNTLFKKSKN